MWVNSTSVTFLISYTPCRPLPKYSTTVPLDNGRSPGMKSVFFWSFMALLHLLRPWVADVEPAQFLCHLLCHLLVVIREETQRGLIEERILRAQPVDQQPQLRPGQCQQGVVLNLAFDLRHVSLPPPVHGGGRRGRGGSWPA